MTLDPGLEAPVMDTERSYHMTPDEFRRYGREVVDWIADYMEQVGNYPVQSRVEPGEIRRQLPLSPPNQPEPFSSVLADLDRVILPGITHWQSPSFFAYFPANASGPSILGELVSAGLGVQGMLWSTSPACTELETHVMDWMVDLLDLPDRFRSTSAGGGVIQDSASSATLCALLAARERATSGSASHAGVRKPLVAYASTQVHSAFEKAVRIAGLGTDNLRLLDVDAAYALRPETLERAIQADLAAGRQPCFVTATVGTTSSTAIDPIAELADVCRRYDVWLHVDGALAGSAAVCPELRFVNRGLDAVDSYCFNPHKWLFTNFDCDCFYVADRAALVQALSVLPEFLRNAATESGQVIDYRDWQVPLGRRFRALKLWFVLRSYGAEGLAHHVRQHVALAHEFASWVEHEPTLELVAPVPLTLVCLRHRDGDAATQRLIDHVNGSGLALVSHTRLDGRLVVRVSIGQTHTARFHVERLWRLLREAALA
jgi:aromatic-L-amino-acid decarboxylase